LLKKLNYKIGNKREEGGGFYLKEKAREVL
jgi:hypothetical protein